MLQLKVVLLKAMEQANVTPVRQVLVLVVVWALCRNVLPAAPATSIIIIVEKDVKLKLISMEFRYKCKGFFDDFLLHC